jgi:glyoxylase-like metal-dependent hydrolase (beta-lactamase superfamily II)
MIPDGGPPPRWTVPILSCTKENMDRDLLPLVVWDEGEMAKSLASLRALRDRQGAAVFYGHDPTQWAAMPHAPAPLA